MLVDRAIERKRKTDELKDQGKVLGMKAKH
jgi:hypothetical protein